MLRCSSNKASIAATPMRLAIIRSNAEGEPPRCICPRMVTRTSYSGCSLCIRSARPEAPPVISLSATITILLFFDLRKPFLISSSNWSTCVSRSGIMAASAPDAKALFKARKPASRPITSIKNKRSCDVAVSRILSTASIIVLSAVS